MNITITDKLKLHEEQSKREQEECDFSDCAAKKNPETLEEYKKALEHWKDHSLLSGCSHGC